MKRLLWIMVCLGAALCAAAQQHGVVRTLERPGQASVGIQGATINVLEYPNAIVSKKDGKFTFTIEGKRQGDSYTVSRVQKKGYTLVDKQLRGRRFAYSSTVSLEIVMVADQQLEKEKKQIEDRAYNRAKKTYDDKVATLERQLREKTISEREYREKYEELNTNYNNYVQLIDEMAERYATTDYKGLSGINREILKCIENADLERADSLINSKGHFDKREQELLSKQELLEKTQNLTQQLRDDIAAELEDLLQDYYNKYAINAAAYRNDSAAYYLERTVQFYPHDLYIVSLTASFIDNYLADYQQALEYYQLGLRIAKEQYGETSTWAGYFCERIGLTLDKLGDADQALEWQHKALDTYENAAEPDSARIAMSYTLIGRAYISKNEYDKALQYTLKGLEMREQAAEPDSADLAQSYNNLGVIYSTLGDMEKSLECHMRALKIRQEHFGANDEDVAFSYMNIGDTYLSMNNIDKAMEYDQKALDIYQHVMGEAHPFAISLHYKIGNFYLLQEDYGSALTHFQKAFAGSQHHYGIEDARTFQYLTGIAYIQWKMGNPPLAREAVWQYIDTIGQSLGAESPEMAISYVNAGDIFSKIEDYDEATHCFMKAQEIHAHQAVENEYTTAAYSHLGHMLMKQGHYARALDHYQRALDIEKRALGELHPFTALCIKYVADAYRQLGQRQPALEHYRQALDILQQTPDNGDYEQHINQIKAAINELQDSKTENWHR